MLRKAILLLLMTLATPFAAPFRAAAQPPVTGPVQLPESSQAEEEEGVPFLSLRVGLFGSAGTYSMADMNKNIDELSIAVREQWGAPEIKLDRITSGVGAGAGLHMFFRGKVFVALDYERVKGKSDVGGRLGRSDIRVPATAYLGTLGYAIYDKTVRFGFAAGGGYYEADGNANFIVDQETVEHYTMGGTTIGQHYVSFVDTPLLGNFRINAMVGYRRAKVTDPDVVMDVFIPETEPPPGEPPPPPRFPIQESSLDWSGFMARISIDYKVF